MPIYFLAVAVLIAVGIALVVNHGRRFTPTVDGAALLIIGGVFGFLIAAVFSRPFSLPQFSAAPPLAAGESSGSQPAAAPPAVSERPAVPAPSANEGKAASAHINNAGYRIGTRLRRAIPPVVPIGGTLAVMGLFGDASEAAAVTGPATVKVGGIAVESPSHIRGSTFDLEVPTATMVAGGHDVVVAFRERDGLRHSVVPFRVVLTSPGTAPPRAAEGAAADASIDVFATLDGQPQRNLSLSVARSQFVLVQGWAFDSAAHEPARTVLIAIDGTTFFRATTGLERPDVALARSAAYLASGFAALIPCGDLAQGHHDVGIMTVNAGRRHAVAVPLSLDVQ